MIYLWCIQNRGDDMDFIDKIIDTTPKHIIISDDEKQLFEKFGRLHDKAKELWQPVPMAVLTVEVNNPGQEPHGIKRISKTWVRNAYTYLQQQIALANYADASFGSGYHSAKTTAGSIKSSYVSSRFPSTLESTGYGYGATAGTATRGILVGTDTTAESFESYALGAVIAHGTGAGQMSYNESSVSKAWDGTPNFTWTATHERIINNNSGGTITVNECALYAYLINSFTYGVGYSYQTFMTNRDKLAIGEAILDAGQLTVTYDLVITFPE